MSESSPYSRVSVFLEEHLTWKNFKRLGFWVLVFLSLRWAVRGAVNKLVYQSEREAREILAMTKLSTRQKLMEECEQMMDHQGYAALPDRCIQALLMGTAEGWYWPLPEDIPSSTNDARFFSHILEALLSPRTSGFAQQLSILYTFIIGAALVILWRFTLAPNARPARYRRWFPGFFTPWLHWVPFISLGLFMSLLITFLLRLYLLIPLIWLLLGDLLSWAKEWVQQTETPEWRDPVGLLDG